MTMSLVIEGIVACLLVVTIGFCVLLVRRLKRLKADETALQDIVADLMQATGKADSAIRNLRATADEHETALRIRLNQAADMAKTLEKERVAAEALMDRVGKLAQLARARPATPRPAMRVVPTEESAPAHEAVARRIKRIITEGQAQPEARDDTVAAQDAPNEPVASPRETAIDVGVRAALRREPSALDRLRSRAA